MPGNPNCTGRYPAGAANRDERCREFLAVAKLGIQCFQATAILHVEFVLDVLAHPFVIRFDLIPSVQRIVAKLFGDRLDPPVVAFDHWAGF